MNENAPVLREHWLYAEEIDDKGNYKLLKYRKIEQISFYIRVLREWFIPCVECQKKLKKQLANGRWILGNKKYAPDIELNTTKDELDDESWVTLKTRKPTKKERERIGIEGFKQINVWDVKAALKREDIKE